MHLTAEEQRQYRRHIQLDTIGEYGQIKLKQAKVLVIGAGGLSCAVLQYIAAAGIGTIGIIDDDIVSQSNLQRQILYRTEDIGKSKVVCAKKTLSRLNPYITINAYNECLNTSNAIELFKAYDIIVDGTDNFPTRYLSNDAAVITDTPLVFGSIFKFDGQVSVFNFKNGPTYRCLYPTPPEAGSIPNCAEVGVLGVLPGIIGSLQANEVLKIILELEGVLSGKLLTFNTRSMKQLILAFEKSNFNSINKLDDDYQLFCGVPKVDTEIHFQDYEQHATNYTLLDVRTQIERDDFHLDSIHIPLDELTQRHLEIPQHKPLVVFCKSGLRSKKAIKILENSGFTNALINLKNGILNV